MTTTDQLYKLNFKPSVNNFMSCPHVFELNSYTLSI